MSATSPTYISAQVRTPDMDLLWSIGKGDMKQTELAYKFGNVRYEKPPVQLKEERWFKQVTNENTGEFIQPEQLKALGLVSPDYNNTKKYPVKSLNALIRIKTTDDKEWLLSRQMWIGLDRLGNDAPLSMDDKELWLKPVFTYGQVRTNLNDPPLPN